jgi:hypothetical protein
MANTDIRDCSISNPSPAHYILSIQNFGCDGYDVVGDYDTRGEAQQIYNDRYADMAIPYEIARLP